MKCNNKPREGIVLHIYANEVINLILSSDIKYVGSLYLTVKCSHLFYVFISSGRMFLKYYGRKIERVPICLLLKVKNNYS